MTEILHIFYLKQSLSIDYSFSNRSITNSLRSAGRGYYDEDEEGSMDNFIIDDGLDQEEEVRMHLCTYVCMYVCMHACSYESSYCFKLCIIQLHVLLHVQSVCMYDVIIVTYERVRELNELK